MKRIFAATDLSNESMAALRFATRQAQALGAELDLVFIVDSLGDNEMWSALLETPEEIEHRVLRDATQRARDFARRALASEIDTGRHRVLVSFGSPADEIERLARQKGADLVVCGTTGHSRLHNVLFGSTANRLAHTARTPVYFVPPEAKLPPYAQLLAPVDSTEVSRRSLAHAALLAEQWDAQLLVLHALSANALAADYEPAANFVPMVDALTEQRREHFEALVAELGVAARTKVEISRLTPAQSILEAVDAHGIDMIVMGTHGRTGLGRILLGSTAHKILRQAPCVVATLGPEA